MLVCTNEISYTLENVQIVETDSNFMIRDMEGHSTLNDTKGVWVCKNSYTSNIPQNS